MNTPWYHGLGSRYFKYALQLTACALYNSIVSTIDTFHAGADGFGNNHCPDWRNPDQQGVCTRDLPSSIVHGTVMETFNSTFARTETNTTVRSQISAINITAISAYIEVILTSGIVEFIQSVLSASMSRRQKS